MEMNKTVSKPQYGFIDVTKFFLALLIVSSHYLSENAAGRISSVIDRLSSLYVIVVPFFFACSGFLLFRKMDGSMDDAKKIKVYSKKILVMYAGWSFVYIAFNILTWIRFGTTGAKLCHYLINAVTYSTYKTIWFLPATVIGVLLTYYFSRKFGTWIAAVIAVIMYIISCVGASYSFFIKDNHILETYNYFFTSTRNGIFNGFPFVFIGYLVAQKEKNGFKKGRIINIMLSGVWGIAFVVEALMIKPLGAPNVNTLFFLLPFTYFFLNSCLGIELKSSKATLWLRNMSTDIFLCQRIYLSALPILFPNSIFYKLLVGNPYIGWVSMILLSMITAALLVWISKRNKCLANFC